MIIQQKRIRNVDRYLNFVPRGTSIVLGVPKAITTAGALRNIGFAGSGQINDSILPAFTFGPNTRFNAQGKTIRLKNLPKIDVTHSVYSTWHDWHGNPHSGYVDRTYHCYPSQFISPPSVEFRIRATTAGEELIIADPITYIAGQSASICHIINLFLEIFTECHVFTENLDRIIQAPLNRLNWRLLPPGNLPFATIRQAIAPILNSRPTIHRPVIEGRLEIINGHRPDFVAVGEGGFGGYLVFAFPNRNLFLLESTFIDNATYVLGSNWRTLSQMTKAELLDNNLIQDRIIHRDGWRVAIDRLLR
jgi:hypothetical protein